jgi:hypothetical protein
MVRQHPFTAKLAPASNPSPLAKGNSKRSNQDSSCSSRLFTTPTPSTIPVNIIILTQSLERTGKNGKII